LRCHAARTATQNRWKPATGISSWEALTHDTLAQKRNRALILLLSTGARSSEILRFDRSEWKLERLWATSSNRLPIAGSQHVYRQLA
jgi:hypothetical protein